MPQPKTRATANGLYYWVCDACGSGSHRKGARRGSVRSRECTSSMRDHEKRCIQSATRRWFLPHVLGIPQKAAIPCHACGSIKRVTPAIGAPSECGACGARRPWQRNDTPPTAIMDLATRAQAAAPPTAESDLLRTETPT